MNDRITDGYVYPGPAAAATTTTTATVHGRIPYRPDKLFVMDLELGDPTKLAVFLGFPPAFGVLWGRENVNGALEGVGGATTNNTNINTYNDGITTGSGGGGGSCKGVFGGAGVCVTAPKSFKTIHNASDVATANACCELCEKHSRCMYWVFISEPTNVDGGTIMRTSCRLKPAGLVKRCPTSNYLTS